MFVIVTYIGTLLAHSEGVTPVLKVYKLSQNEQIEWLSLYSKIVFRNDSIIIYNSNRDIILQKPLNEVRVLVFEDVENGTPTPSDVEQETFSDYTLKFYPNPATYSVRVTNYEPIQSIQVYSLSGQLMTVGVAIDGSTAQVNVSSLTTGQYIILVNQTAVKLIKQ